MGKDIDHLSGGDPANYKLIKLELRFFKGYRSWVRSCKKNEVKAEITKKGDGT